MQTNSVRLVSITPALMHKFAMFYFERNCIWTTARKVREARVFVVKE